MQQRYRTVKFLLRRFVARCGKAHRSQLLATRMLTLAGYAARRQQGQQNSRNEFPSAHFPPPTSCSIEAFQVVWKTQSSCDEEDVSTADSSEHRTDGVVGLCLSRYRVHQALGKRTIPKPEIYVFLRISETKV